ncbi:MAG: PKD domain-containing protein, partial [Bacteroidota bacterium]
WLNAYDTGHITRTVNGGGNFTANTNMYEWFLSNSRSGAQPTPPINTAPTASAGSAQTITLPTSTVNLSGSGSGTNGATISSYSWAKTSGPSSANISSVNAASSSVTALVQGVYVFTLTVKDNHGLTSAASVTITVNGAANQLPVSNAGNNTSITLPTNNTNLNGSASKDSDGSISSYAWTKTSGPSSGSISSPNAATTSVTGLVQGAYVFSLKVTDNAGASASSSVTVTVNAAVSKGNQYPAANAGANITITLPGTLTLDASASSDPDGFIAAYHWTQTSGPIGPILTNRDGKTTTVTGLFMGTYTFVLQVKDNEGLEASAAVAITVNPGSSLPSVPQANVLPIANPGSNRTITLPTALTLDASASSDPDGYIASYRWTQTAGPTGPLMATRDAKTTAVTGLVPGNYTFVLQLVDNSGGNASQSVNILVNAATTPPVGNVLGYIKMSVGPYQACDDASSSGRTPVYGTSIANGSLLYTDAAMKKTYNGGWNWFSFTPVLGGTVTQAFAVYPTGGILLLRSCASGGARIAAANTTAKEDEETLKRMKDSASGISIVPRGTRLSLYPNPVHSNTTIQLYSADNGIKTISVYNSAGVLQAKYNWQTVPGNNTYSLKDVSGLANGLYIIDIRDHNGKSNGSVKFLKM